MHLRELGIEVIGKDYPRPGCEEVRFLIGLGRKWAFDFTETGVVDCRPKLAFEIEGVHYKLSDGPTRHQMGAGFEEDCRKYGEAAVSGYQVFRFTPAMVLNGEARDLVRRWLVRVRLRETATVGEKSFFK